MPAPRTSTRESAPLSFWAAQKWFWKGCKPISVCPLARGENHLSERPIPETRPTFAGRGAGSPEVSYLALHPMGFSVPPRSRSARWALTPPFHPYRRLAPVGGMFSVALSVSRPRGQAARVYPPAEANGYAASRPMEFGLSSPETSPGAILRPSKTKVRLRENA